MRKPNGITPRQWRFIQEYLIDLHVTKAAIRAGYSPHTAMQQGSYLLRKVNIWDAVEQLQEERAARYEITAERVLLELKRVAFADVRNVVKFGPTGVDLRSSKSLGDDEAAAVAEVSETITQHGGSKKVKMHNKIDALKTLLEHLPKATAEPIKEGETDGRRSLTADDVKFIEQLLDDKKAN